jgi:hypothetical protein
MTRNQNLAAVGLLIAIAAATALWLQLRPSPDRPATAPATVPTAAAPVTAPLETAAKPRVRRMTDPAGRGELLRQIREVHARRTSLAFSSTSPTPTPELPAVGSIDKEPVPIDKEYIRTSVRELIPLLVECYEQGLARDPKLAGSIIVDFTIEGEPGVGGVVGESAIDAAGSTLTDPAFRECVQEIEPPADGGVVKVRYPFEFRSDPE